jgi:hypothetical protein
VPLQPLFQNPGDVRLAHLAVPGELAVKFCCFHVKPALQTPAGKKIMALAHGGNVDFCRREIGLDLDAVERLVTIVQRDQMVYAIRTTETLKLAPVLQALAPGAREQKRAGKRYYLAEDRWQSLLVLDEHTFVYGPTDAVDALLARPAGRADGDLAEALKLAAGGRHHVVSYVDMSTAQALCRKGLDRTPQPDKQAAAVVSALAALLEARSGLVTVDLADGFTLNGRLQFPTLDKARTAAPALPLIRDAFLPRILPELPDDPRVAADPEAAMLKAARTALQTMKVRREDTAVSLTLPSGTEALPLAVMHLAGALVMPFPTDYTPAVTGWSETENVRNMKRIADAMLAYHEKHGHLPPRLLRGKDGQPLLSWRVLLLPHLGEEKLFREFKLDEPWDGPHNRQLVARMPRVYFAYLAGPTVPVTAYQVFAGKGAAFEGDQVWKLADLTDGASETLLFAEAGRPVPWTKPEDLDFAPGQPLPRLGGTYGETFRLACADGQVRELPSGWVPHPRTGLMPQMRRQPGFDDRLIRAFITRSGGEKVDLSKVFSWSNTTVLTPGASTQVMEPACPAPPGPLPAAPRKPADQPAPPPKGPPAPQQGPSVRGDGPSVRTALCHESLPTLFSGKESS